MDDLLREHFNHPRNSGELSGADGAGEAGDSGCGAVIGLFLGFEGDNIGKATFLASGSSAAIAAGSLLTELISGKSWREVASLPAASLETALGGDEEHSPGASSQENPSRAAAIKNAAFYAIEALHAALEDAIAKGNFPAKILTDSNAVLVAMSGGVDSSVACMIEKESGRQVIGVTLRLWSDPACLSENAVNCCSPESIRDARSICHRLGIPHLTVDCTADFRAAVVDDFVTEYLKGRTPNPCARCNGTFRFPKLVDLAGMLGAGSIASGHYARIVQRDGRRFIARGADRSKDQSYVLWGIPRALLSRIELPLGDLSKEETRRLARKAGLHVHDRPESQEICFIPDNDYRRFLRSRTRKHPGEGEILDGAGTRLGVHTGYTDYTVGQRHGLGVGAPEPLFVLGTVPEKNQVIVGSHEELSIRQLTIHQVNSFADANDGALAGGKLEVQLRYNSGAVPGRLEMAGDSTDRGMRIFLDEPVYGVAPGQSAVIYSGEAVIAAGVIEATSVLV